MAGTTINIDDPILQDIRAARKKEGRAIANMQGSASDPELFYRGGTDGPKDR